VSGDARIGKGRLEAFSDGVIAVIITIMVLEMKVPHGTEIAALIPMWPVFLAYVLSYVYTGIYWNNHHHLFHAVDHVTGRIMWANLHLLFWLSLVPFTTGWMSENHFAPVPTALYGGVLFGASIAYYLLSQSLIRVHGRQSTLGRRVGSDRKGLISSAIYLVAISVAFVWPWVAFALYTVVAAIWFVPDRRIERSEPR
jgi:uncharacterized membrane protein